MTSDSYDVVIVGSGINGAGVAQAAVAKGYTTLVLEKNKHPGMETSSRSSKLIHGGLRYLEMMEFQLVRESLKERELLLKLAPDLVHLQAFNIPLYKDTSRSALSLHAGLSVYAVLAGLKKHSFYKQLPAKHLNKLEGLIDNNLKTVFQYHDAQTDDRALTRAVLSSAIELGAEYQCQAKVTSINITHSGVETSYLQNGVEKNLKSSVLVNASGPWVSRLNERMTPPIKNSKPDLIQGAHLVFKTHLKQAYYLEGLQDRRAIFLLPWKNQTLLGTTENMFEGEPADVRVLESERSYLLDVYQHYFPTHDKTIVEEMAGCRVLPAAGNTMFKRSRETVYKFDSKKRPRVVSIIGGKLTVYRKTADKVMHFLQQVLPPRKVKARTENIKLSPVDEF